jgi:hypothetical protein
MGFSQVVWTPVKFKQDSKLDLPLNFIIQNLESSKSWAKKENSSSWVYRLEFGNLAKFGNFSRVGSAAFVIFKSEQLWILEKSSIMDLGLAHWSSAALLVLPATSPPSWSAQAPGESHACATPARQSPCRRQTTLGPCHPPFPDPTHLFTAAHVHHCSPLSSTANHHRGKILTCLLLLPKPARAPANTAPLCLWQAPCQGADGCRPSVPACITVELVCYPRGESMPGSPPTSSLPPAFHHCGATSPTTAASGHGPELIAPPWEPNNHHALPRLLRQLPWPLVQPSVPVSDLHLPPPRRGPSGESLFVPTPEVAFAPLLGPPRPAPPPHLAAGHWNRSVPPPPECHGSSFALLYNGLPAQVAGPGQLWPMWIVCFYFFQWNCLN